MVDMPEYMTGAKSLFIKGSSEGCLLLHGAGGGTTWDLKEFASTLHEQTGMTVWLPELTGFGTKPEDLFDITFDDWLSDAREGHERLLQDCDKLCVVGHSVGGILALLLASEFGDIGSIVTWAVPISVQNRLLPLFPFISRIPGLRRLIPERHPTPAPQWMKERGWVGYDWIPTGVGLALYDGMNRLKKSLDRITCSSLIIQGSDDTDVSQNSAERIYNGISSEKKEIWIVEGAGHSIMNYEDIKGDLFTRTTTFLIDNM